MGYLITLIIWMTITFVCENIRVVKTYNSNPIGGIIGVMVRYGMWGWLIYEVALHF